LIRGSRTTISGDTAAFRANYGTSAGVGIFKGNGGALTTIAKTGDPAPVGTLSLLFNPSIGGGSVAFLGNYGAQHALFVGDGGALTAVIKRTCCLGARSVSRSISFGLDPTEWGLAFSICGMVTRVALAVRSGPPIGITTTTARSTQPITIWARHVGPFVARSEPMVASAA
jgi:hypothetical protein